MARSALSHLEGMSVGSRDPQPTVNPIDTHRLLFHYLHERQSSVLKFKAMVPVCP